MANPTLSICRGRDIIPHLPALAWLRIRVFRDYPYLYDGDAAYEASYLERYAANPESFFVLAFDGDTLVGAATGQPLDNEVDDFRAPFEAAGYRPAGIFYYGESVLLPEFRGRGIGKALMEARERHAKSAGFGHAAFCAVERPLDHPLKPDDYRPLHDFWNAWGYRRTPSLSTTFAWKDIEADEETDKPMIFWLKALDS